MAASGAAVWRAVDRDVFSVDTYPRGQDFHDALRIYGPSARAFSVAGTLAGSVMNSQPWAFKIQNGRILIFADMSRWAPGVDPFAEQLVMSVGGAISNIQIAARAHGFMTGLSILVHDLGTLRDSRGLTLVAEMEIQKGGPVDRESGQLLPSVALRRTNRHAHDLGHGIAPAILKQVTAATKFRGGELTLISHRERRHVLFAELLEAAERYRSGKPEYREDLTRWFRCRSKSAARRGDGIGIDALGISPIYLPAWKFWGCASAGQIADFRADIIGTRAPFSNYLGALLVANEDNSIGTLLAAGAAWQRINLTATRGSLSVHPSGAFPVFLASAGKEQASAAAKIFSEKISTKPGFRPVLTFRIGRATADGGNTPRRPLDSVVHV